MEERRKVYAKSAVEETNLLAKTSNSMQILDLLESFKHYNSDEYAKAWNLYEQKLYKYELSKRDFTD